MAPVAASAASASVRVSRNGNSRTLTVPTEIVEQAGIETGDAFEAVLLAAGILYRRVGVTHGGRRFVGEGAARYLGLPAGAVLAAGPDPSPTPPLDWDY